MHLQITHMVTSFVTDVRDAFFFSSFFFVVFQKGHVKVKGTPNQNLACFVRYLKIINTF